MTEQGYDATLDPRTGRPVLPLDTENARKAEGESQPLTDEDNQGISMGDDDDEDSGETDANNDMPHSAAATEAAKASSVDINSTVPRMRAAEADMDEQTSDVDEEDEADELIDEPVFVEETIEGERPEALAKFAEVARNDGQPVRHGVEATSETAPIPTDPALKQDAATRVLREGVLGQDQGADEAIERLPDRTDAAERRHRDQ